jgi:hypothetical protein
LAALSGLGVLAFSLALGEVFLGDVFSGLSGDILTCFTGDSFLKASTPNPDKAAKPKVSPSKTVSTCISVKCC